MVGKAKPKEKKKTRSQLVKQLDKVFSIFIRLRDSDSNGYCKCITCNVRQPRKEAQNCHFISRSNYKYRRDEKNCYAGCMRCNVFLNGNYKAYTMVMINKFGKKRVEERIKEVNAPYSIKGYEIEELIEKYERQSIKLIKEKNI